MQTDIYKEYVWMHLCMFVVHSYFKWIEQSKKSNADIIDSNDKGCIHCAHCNAMHIFMSKNNPLGGSINTFSTKKTASEYSSGLIDPLNMPPNNWKHRYEQNFCHLFPFICRNESTYCKMFANRNEHLNHSQNGVVSC